MGFLYVPQATAEILATYPGDERDVAELCDHRQAWENCLQRAHDLSRSSNAHVFFDIDWTLLVEEMGMTSLRLGVELVSHYFPEPGPGIVSWSPKARVEQVREIFARFGIIFDPTVCCSAFEDAGYPRSGSEAYLGLQRRGEGLAGSDTDSLRSSCLLKLPLLVELRKRLGVDIILIDDGQ